ncbi:DNA-directed RNA polymerase D subunit [Theileria orientalis]|uniref:DNA-directed RNA polymerase D subunit n=1 Tax=Theileria orientalis TaxID=68886 RepID=A0A976M604_THEOR|nr:DNA-directed RNA polymerase D subunit [Theileria orientalis]
MFLKICTLVFTIIYFYKHIFFIFNSHFGFHGFPFAGCVSVSCSKRNDLNSNLLSFINPTVNKVSKSAGLYGIHGINGKESKKKVRFPFDQDVPLSDVPIPPWAIEFVEKRKEEPYIPRHMTQQEIESGIEKYNVEARSQSETKHIKESPCLKLKSYGFKFKQIQPIRHHNGKAFTFFYVHSLHTDVIPVFLNSLRRVARRYLGAGRITALRIPGMHNEFFSVMGLREDFFELSKNLRGVILRNVPESATFNNPIIATLRVKGPIIAVAGHLKFKDKSNKTGETNDEADASDENDKEVDINGQHQIQEEVIMNRPYSEKIEVVNKNHYLCSVSNGSYLTMEVKIEHIANYVIPEYGPESLNRDITEDGFIHFCSSCNPVEVFAFTGERRGLDENSTNEIVTLEVHTDGSTTPRVGLLRSATFLLNWFERTLYALRTRLSRDLYAARRENRDNTSILMQNHEYNRNLPWNPYLSPEDRLTNKIKWFYRKDVIRQYPIDPESKLAKQEQLKEWERALEDQIIYEQNIPPVLSDEEADPEENLLLKRMREQKAKEDNPPRWIFKDPIGPGNASQQTVLGFDNDRPLFDPESLSH